MSHKTITLYSAMRHDTKPIDHDQAMVGRATISRCLGASSPYQDVDQSPWYQALGFDHSAPGIKLSPVILF